MKTLTLTCSLVAIAAAGFASNAAAQRYDNRVDVPAIVNADRHNDRDMRDGDWEQRARYDLERLNGEVAQVRREIGDSRESRIRERFHGVVQSSERLNAAFAQHRIRGSEVRRRADNIRAELDAIRRELRSRSVRPHH